MQPMKSCCYNESWIIDSVSNIEPTWEIFAKIFVNTFFKMAVAINLFQMGKGEILGILRHRTTDVCKIKALIFKSRQ